MTHNDFKIGTEFTCGGNQWRCTDKGTRVIVAICLSRVWQHGAPGKITVWRTDEKRDWFIGPPYAVAESVFDENDMPGCEEITAVDAKVPGAGKDQVVGVAPDFDKSSRIVF